MAASIVLSSRKVNPLSLTSAMHRAAGQNEFNKKLAQYESHTQHVRKISKEVALVQQPVEMNIQSVFPHISTIAMMQMLPMRTVSGARVQEYEAMADLAQQDHELALGQGFDMLA
ncbi:MULTISPECIES: hypothetical protein [Deefgea]|uniref:Uncharacterized protein n=1 Tax=Deefgea chitinilytica TaxID=570276 RepID=A0ABS2CEZ7_9NEIS|nr:MULTISPECIES: hypothetical protein [Deefgea]MBM5572637.1 hypothetical protein [Deefgea chitinilytica]MBM9889873.1 hypothetical protein [Deefgea sp. CFH1-16]